MDQSVVAAFVAQALARETGAPVETKSTHVSLLFLSGGFVFKLKRAIVFPYLDFSKASYREKACRSELALNSRAAPELYLGVRRITREPGGLAFDGKGPLVDCIVVMRRFEESSLFDVMAREGRLTSAHIEALAVTVADFHTRAQTFNLESGAKVFADLLDLNEHSFAACGIFTRKERERLNAVFRRELKGLAELLDGRALVGFVRLCHGDLYLRNICWFEGRPTLFDCIEFDQKLARIDVLYDVAFTMMDLWLAERRDLANLLFNRYVSALSRTVPDMPAKIRDGYSALPFFMALRAAIRAHIAASQAGSGDPAVDAAMEREARAYFALAEELLAPRSNAMIAVGGFSGTGKSTLAAAIAGEIGTPPGARTLNSDRTRKAMHKIAPTDRLPASAYEFNITTAVYLRLLSRAMDAYAQGHSVVLDAVYSTEDERAAVAKLAHDCGAPFVGLWLEAPPDVLRRRVRERPYGVSDADLDVLESQLARGAGRIDWVRLDAAAPDLATRALEIVRAAIATKR
ncbi:AAA family ATPase [Rhodoblastus sp.]|uniref:bifunctional aminoglycoside phosphotransferase/ATP-binding protein n=1 Tax=Rhodoblastus sp. TaxID=1962975 RepID=UPI003F9A8A21